MTEHVSQELPADDLSTLLIPLDEHQLLLPNVAVAEIIGYTEAEPVADSPDWLLGFIDWRQQRVPLVCPERLNGQPVAAAGPDRRIAVLNGIIGDPQLPFCAVVVAGVPRQMRITAADISRYEDGDTGPAEKSWALVNGELALIPDLDYLQQQVAALL